MAPEKRRLLERIDQDRELLITFLQEFIRCATPQKLTRYASVPGSHRGVRLRSRFGL
jgi:hypothetical protein